MTPEDRKTDYHAIGEGTGKAMVGVLGDWLEANDVGQAILEESDVSEPENRRQFLDGFGKGFRAGLDNKSEKEKADGI